MKALYTMICRKKPLLSMIFRYNFFKVFIEYHCFLLKIVVSKEPSPLDLSFPLPTRSTSSALEALASACEGNWDFKSTWLGQKRRQPKKIWGFIGTGDFIILGDFFLRKPATKRCTSNGDFFVFLGATHTGTQPRWVGLEKLTGFSSQGFSAAIREAWGFNLTTKIRLGQTAIPKWPSGLKKKHP